MRDIRDDLRERLHGLREQRDLLQAQLQAKLDEIALYEQHLSALLDMEEKRADAEQPRLAFDGPPPPDMVGPQLSVSAKDKLESVILVLLQDGQPRGHTVIRDELERAGFGIGERHFGRKVHGTLMSMRSREMVENLGFGTWRRVIPQRADAA